MVKAVESNLEGVLEGKKQYQVPLFQRVYGWQKKQLSQLWEDISDLAQARQHEPARTHFIGSLVLAASPDNGAVGIQRFLVVDGQQRLTTLTLLLSALRDHLHEVGQLKPAEAITNSYLVNPYVPGEPAKLVPTQADRPAYEAVIRGASGAGGSDHIGEAYRFFRARIAAADDPDDPHDLAAIENAVMRGLALVAVTAESGDNAHRIFESLNNTGLRLTQADLLKNYLFMRVGDRADAVYEGVWLPLERKLSADHLELLFWLDLVQTDETATQSETYIGQQRRIQEFASVAEVEAEIRRIAELGELLATILDPRREADPEVRQRLERIRAWGSLTAYPVVMRILARRAAGTATSEQVARALTYLESYFVRRIIIGRATANLNRTLMQAVRAIATAPEVDSALRTYLSQGRKYFATDAQVRDAVHKVPFYWYGKGGQKKLILQWLEESAGSKETVDPTNLTIEHVLPQTMSDAVRSEFGSLIADGTDVTTEHERLVQTLGNLTLTGYNSELSNRPFSQKRTQLAASGLRMNQEIAARERWGPVEITERAAAIAERVISLWPGPDETIAEVTDNGDTRRSTVAIILAGIPAGRWTTYGEVALVAGTYPQPLANILMTQPVPNAWRVLQTGGLISPGFRWSDPDRKDDPRKLLESEGMRFNEHGRADPAQHVPAAELAALAGLDVPVEALTGAPWRGTGANVGEAQKAFWSQVRAYGAEHARNVRSWRRASAQNWYDIAIGTSRAHIALFVKSREGAVSVWLYIPDDMELFNQLADARDAIESEIGEALAWDELPHAKASGVHLDIPGNFLDEAEQERLVEWMVRTADRFAEVFPKYL